MNERPHYESDSDLVAEAQILAVLNKGWNCTSMKLSKAYGLDYALIRHGQVGAFAEIKNRNLSFGVDGGYYISLLKLIAAKRLTDTTGLKCLLAVRFSDGEIWTVDFRQALSTIIEFGRHDRNDPYDIEPHAVFDWPAFKSLNHGAA